MTRATSCEWAVVYLGVSTGERFRYLRDDYFPGLAVVAFDPCDEASSHASRQVALRNARLWNSDGTDFTFHVRCFEGTKDIPLIQEQIKGRRLLLISDIRGCARLEDGARLDIASDSELQWQAIAA